jgi:hypothetical protein
MAHAFGTAKYNCRVKLPGSTQQEANQVQDADCAMEAMISTVCMAQPPPHPPTTQSPRKNPRYSLNIMPGGPQYLYGCSGDQKITLVCQESYSWSSSWYPSYYTNWATVTAGQIKDEHKTAVRNCQVKGLTWGGETCLDWLTAGSMSMVNWVSEWVSWLVS